MNKKVSVFFVYSPSSGDSKYLLKMDLFADSLRTHPLIQFIEYPKPFRDDPEPDIKKYSAIEKNILECQLFVAIGTHPSIGLGMEIGIANSCNRTTMVCFETGSSTCGIVSGSRSKNPNLKIIEYSSEKELFDQIIEQVGSMLQ